MLQRQQGPAPADSACFVGRAPLTASSTSFSCLHHDCSVLALLPLALPYLQAPTPGLAHCLCTAPSQACGKQADALHATQAVPDPPSKEAKVELNPAPKAQILHPPSQKAKEHPLFLPRSQQVSQPQPQPQTCPFQKELRCTLLALAG